MDGGLVQGVRGQFSLRAADHFSPVLQPNAGVHDSRGLRPLGKGLYEEGGGSQGDGDSCSWNADGTGDRSPVRTFTLDPRTLLKSGRFTSKFGLGLFGGGFSTVKTPHRRHKQVNTVGPQSKVSAFFVKIFQKVSVKDTGLHGHVCVR